MADFDLATLLGAPALMKAIYARTSGVPTPFDESWFVQDPEDEVEKDYGVFYRYYGQRKTAKYNPYGNPSSTLQMQNMEGVPVKLISSAHNINLPMAKFRNLISTDSTGANLRIDEQGAEQIKRQVGEFGTAFMNQRIAVMSMALASDSVSYDAGGNLLPSSTGALFTVKSGVPAANQGTIVLPTIGGVALGNLNGWGTASTNIANQLEGLDLLASNLTGYKPTKAFYGSLVRGYLMDNTNLVKYFQFNTSINIESIAKNKIPDNTLDKDWTAAYLAQYDDKSGTTQNIWGPNLVAFTPDPKKYPGWCSFLTGTTDVPTDIGKVGSNGVDMLGSCKPIKGMYAYALINPDPISIKVVAGDVFLYVIKVPSAVFQATVL